MVMNWQTKSSFLFGTTDMFTTFGIQLTQDGLPVDVLMPDLRARKVTVPLRHGAYDYGAKYYDERAIQITCVTTKVLDREDVREIAYLLSKKAQIRFWTEPEKYYIGRVYAAPTLEQLRKVGNRFDMTFICEPFAYGTQVTDNFTNRIYIPSYEGTASTPTMIIIRNTATSGNAVNIRITQSIKQEN